MTKNGLIIVALVVLGFAGQLTTAETTRTPEAEQRLAQAQARLNLSEEQLDQMAPVLEESLAERRTILSSYGINLDNPGNSSQRPGFRQARAMRGELEAVRADTLARLEGILSKEQLDEFKRMQEEQRAEMRERIRGGTSAN